MQPHVPDVAVGGRIKLFYSRWKLISSDPEILDIVSGMHIELIDLPLQNRIPPPLRFSKEEEIAAQEQIDTLLQKNAIVYSHLGEPGEYISNIFLIPKRDGGLRTILNLKSFNFHVQYFKFKMQTLNRILENVTPLCYMAVFDFSDAYLSVSIAREHVKFLKFRFKDKVLMYIVLPFGISSAPRKFSKLLVPIISYLHSCGIIVLTYIDDGFTASDSFTGCYDNIITILKTFSYFGFIIHQKKSAPFPSRRVRSLGFHINSETMLVTLPSEKVENAMELCNFALHSIQISIQTLAQLIGTLISLFPACPLGKLYYRHLERLKVQALRDSHGSFDGLCILNVFCLQDLHWWLQNIPTTAAPIRRTTEHHEIFSDSSNFAWGGFFPEINLATQGFYTPQESSNIIAVKEMLAAYYVFRSFQPYFTKNSVLIRSDSVATVCYIREMGGMKNLLMDDIARQLWFFAIKNNIWISSSFIKGESNSDADFFSRTLNDRTDWTLPMETFSLVCSTLFQPSIDLFASRLNARLERYISWIPDPYCENVDSFSISWTNEEPYLFPPISLISRCLAKIIADKTERAILIFPLWLAQCWMGTLLQHLISPIYVLPENPPLYLPWQTTSMRHPLHARLLLSAAIVSANPLKHWIYLQTLPRSLKMESVPKQRKLTRQFIKNGFSLHVQGHSIPICLL